MSSPDPGGAVGLSMSHISPPGREAHSTRTTARRILLASDTRPQPVITVAVGGSLLRVQNACYPAPERAGHKRGVVKQFSQDSRRRLTDLMASINRQRLASIPLFMTLTYPNDWPADPATWKGHLDALLKRLARRWPEASAIWRMEFQRRGAPHFHLLVFGVRFISAQWLARAWYHVVGSEDLRHLGAGTEVKRIKSWRGVLWYVAKYMCKAADGMPAGPVGRWWGVMNRECLPIDLLAIPVGHRDFFTFRRVLIRYCQARRRQDPKQRYRPKVHSEYLGLKVFTEYPVMLQLLRAVA